MSISFKFKSSTIPILFSFKIIDKERDIEIRTATLQRELKEENEKQQKLQNDIHQLNQQLQEAKNGLMAATRLSDQLELNQLTIERLNSDSKCSDKPFFYGI